MGFHWVGLISAALVVAACDSSENEETDGASGAAGAASGAAGAASGAAGTTSTGGGGNVEASVANAAVILGSCLPDDGVNRNALYLWETGASPRFWHHTAPATECLVATKQGCVAVEECLGWTLEPSATTCAASCAGSVFAACYDGFRVSIDCAKLGLSCDPVALCSEAPSEACDAGTFARSCAGSEPAFCDDGAVFRGPDCAAFGLGCEAGHCVGTGATCTGEPPDDQGGVYFDGTACDGDALVACVGGREVRRDCAAVAPGFGCQSFGGEPFCGLASECLPALDASRYGDEERCEGTTLVFCNAGRVERVDCTSLGFTGCDVTDGFGCVPGPADFE